MGNGCGRLHGNVGRLMRRPIPMLRRLAVALAALVALCAPVAADIVIRIDRAAQTLSVAVDGAALSTWPVSTARPGYHTPAGTYHPLRLERVWFSRKYDNAPMPNAIFFFGGYAIHGTTEVGSLGRPVSHGCIRLAPGNAKQLFDLVRARPYRQTRIIVAGRESDTGRPSVASAAAGGGCGG